TFRCAYYPSGFSGFDGHNLIPGNTIEAVNPMSAACSLNLGTADQLIGESTVIYPNPVKDILNVRLSEKFQSADIMLVNNLGQIVYASETTSGTIRIDCNQFNSGLYFLKISANGNQIVKKVIIR
ncbi:MAG: T9SS type A sorting domain-containing protein, partial [Flavobacterium sp.]